MWQRQALKRFIYVCVLSVRKDNKCGCFGHTTICSNPDPKIPQRKFFGKFVHCFTTAQWAELSLGFVFFFLTQIQINFRSKYLNSNSWKIHFPINVIH